MLYVLGGGLKFAVMGPEILRRHLSDVGFPAAISIHVLTRSHYPVSLSSHEQACKDQAKHDHQLFLRVLIALGLSYAYEIVTGLLYSVSDMSVKVVGSFDWTDIAVYTIGAGCAVAILLIAQRDRKSTRLNSSHTEIYTLSLHDALPICE